LAIFAARATFSIWLKIAMELFDSISIAEANVPKKSQPGRARSTKFLLELVGRGQTQLPRPDHVAVSSCFCGLVA
jgi:hypothetical protein